MARNPQSSRSIFGSLRREKENPIDRVCSMDFSPMSRKREFRKEFDESAKEARGAMQELGDPVTLDSRPRKMRPRSS